MKALSHMLLSVLAPSTILTSGCFGSAGDTSAGSCLHTTGTEMSCMDFLDGFTVATAQMDCEPLNPSDPQSMAAYSSMPCTDMNRIGRCVLTVTANGRSVIAAVSYYPPSVEADAKASCDSLDDPSHGLTTMWEPG